MTQETIVRGRQWGKEWSTPCPAVGMKGMRETFFKEKETEGAGFRSEEYSCSAQD